MSEVITEALLQAGLRADFWRNYELLSSRQMESNLPDVMDLDVTATSRTSTFGYIEAPPIIEHWDYGQPIPEDAMDSVQWDVPVYAWGRRVKWSLWDREDDQTGSLFQIAQGAGRSAATLPDRFLIDILEGTTTTLPGTLLAPDGVAMFSATDGKGAARFGVTGGNLVSGSGIASLSAIHTDFYTGYSRWLRFQDGKETPMFDRPTVDGPVIVMFNAANVKVFDEAFRQMRQGVVLGTDAGVTPTNLVLDAGRRVILWPTQRLTGDSWFMFLKDCPVKPTFLMERTPMQEQYSMMSDNHSDLTRTMATEYIQFFCRKGAGLNLPVAAMKISN